MIVWNYVGLFCKVRAEAGDCCSGSLAWIVVGFRVSFALAVVPDLDCWEASNTESSTKSFMDGGIDLSKFYLSLEILRGLLILWLKSLAMPTPWSIKFDDPNIL